MSTAARVEGIIGETACARHAEETTGFSVAAEHHQDRGLRPPGKGQRCRRAPRLDPVAQSQASHHVVCQERHSARERVRFDIYG